MKIIELLYVFIIFAAIILILVADPFNFNVDPWLKGCIAIVLLGIGIFIDR